MSVSAKVQISKMLREWRQVQAATENVELYRILNNNTINLIADQLPETNIDLLSIKGLGPKKTQKYGKQILEIVQKVQVPATNKPAENIADDGSISVSEFISRINFSLAKHTVRIYGEVYDEVKLRGRAIYFKIKDPEQDAILECFAWKDTFEDKGAFPKEGAEVVLEGQVQIYPPTGRFSLQVKLLELRGEGLLKQAFEKLKKDLEASGAFEADKKRSIDGLPRKIAVITATGSDAETDFLTHVGQYGITIDKYDVRVEGIKSETEIITAFKKIGTASKNYDCVVITRGGGSLESLQSYNTKGIVDAVMSCKYPVISAVGHERDVTLCDLVADIRVSTPTDAGKFINSIYQDFLRDIQNTIQQIVQQSQHAIQSQYDYFNKVIDKQTHQINFMLREVKNIYQYSIKTLRNELNVIKRLAAKPDLIVEIINKNWELVLRNYRQNFKSQQLNSLRAVTTTINQYELKVRHISDRLKHLLNLSKKTLLQYDYQFDQNHTQTKKLLDKKLMQYRKRLELVGRLTQSYNPEHVLRRGYAIISTADKTILSKKMASEHSLLNIRFIDGNIQVVNKDHHD